MSDREESMIRSASVGPQGPFWLLLCAALSISAQAQPVAPPGEIERFQRQMEQFRRETRALIDPQIPVGQRTLFDFGGYYNFNYLSLDDQQGDNRVLRQHDLVGYARLNIDGVHELYASVRNTYEDFHRGDSFDGDGDTNEFFLDRAYYRFDLARHFAAYKGENIDYNFVFQGGRQLVYWANGLTLSQVLDAAVIDLEYGPFTLELLGGLTTPDTIDFDASRPDFDDETNRGFYGAMLSTEVGRHRPFVFLLFQQDYNSDENLQLGIINTTFEYWSWYVGVGSSGSIGDRLLYGLELVYEGGTGKSNSFEEATFFPLEQTEEDIQAWAADVRLDYLFNDSRRTRLSFETILASGDDDRLHTNNTFGGNRPGTDDHAFNAFGLLNTGLAFSPTVSNLMLFRVGASTFPIPDHSLFGKMQVGADFFVFNKMNRRGGIDETTFDGRYLGVEPDLYLNWQLTSDITLSLRYGVFFPNEDVVQENDTRQFFFGSLTFAF
jgi:hypothetical protein